MNKRTNCRSKDAKIVSELMMLSLFVVSVALVAHRIGCDQESRNSKVKIPKCP